MKHIKLFNERLSPEVYKSASDKLKEKGHIKRSKELLRYSINDSKETLFDFTTISYDRNFNTKYKGYVGYLSEFDMTKLLRDQSSTITIKSVFKNSKSSFIYEWVLCVNNLGNFYGLNNEIRFSDRKQAIEYKKKLLEFLNSEDIRREIDDLSEHHNLGPDIKYKLVEVFEKIPLNNLYK